MSRWAKLVAVGVVGVVVVAGAAAVAGAGKGADDPPSDKAAEAAAHATRTSDADADPDAASQWPAGIFDDPEAPAPGMVFLGNNRWVGRHADRSVAVYAGRAGDDPTRGRVLVLWASAADTSGTTLDLPGAGALRVVAGAPDATTITLVDAAGVRHRLDVVTPAWR